MSYALLDNATLTAVQRVLGEATYRSKDNIDVDILAFENLITAILFYDEILVVDDYKDKFRESRRKKFDFMRFLSPDEFKVKEIGDNAKAKADLIKPEIRGGKFINEDFAELISSLKTKIICTWDISSSVYFLNLKGLMGSGTDEFKKFGRIASAIFSELQDSGNASIKVGSNVKLVDRYGKNISDSYTVPNAKWNNGGEQGGASSAIYAFVASLNWLANRTIYYSDLAQYLRADAFLYPIRQSYQHYYLKKSLNLETNFVKQLIDEVSRNSLDVQAELRGINENQTSAIELPMFSAWLVSKTGDVSKIIELAFNERENRDIKLVRQRLRELRVIMDEKSIVDASRERRKIIEEIETSTARLKSYYGLKTAQGVPVNYLIKAYNTIGSLKGLPAMPEIGGTIKIPNKLLPLMYKRGFGSLYRELNKDLENVWSLGKARNLLGAMTIIEDDSIAYNPKAEDPRYKNAHSDFKSPM